MREVGRSGAQKQIESLRLGIRALEDHLDVGRMIERVNALDLGWIISNGRAKLDLDAPKDAVAALEQSIQLRLDVNERFGPPSYLIHGSIASVLAEYSASYEGFEPTLEKQRALRQAAGPAMPAFVRALGIDPTELVATEEKTSAEVGPGGRRDLELDLWLGTKNAYGGGALVRAMMMMHERTQEPMPLLAKLRERFGASDLMEGVGIFAVQHVLGSTRGLFSELEAMGLDPHGSLIAGKISSSDGISRLRFEGYSQLELPLSHGLPGDPTWSPLAGATAGEILDDGLHNFSVRFADDGRMPRIPHIGSVVLGDAKQALDTAILLDDGAEAISRVIRDPERLDGTRLRRRAAVEQTRFGANRIRALIDELDGIPFGVVNVAESAVKLHLESVLIGWSVAHEVEQTIARLEADGVPRGREVAILGYGAVGRAVAIALEELGYVVRVYDSREGARGQAHDDRFDVAEDDEARAKMLSEVDYVIGATGTTSMRAEDFRALKKGAVLFSASSSTVEFAIGDAAGISPREPEDPEHARADFDGRSIGLGNVKSPHHWHRVIDVDGKDVLLANSGYPINLTGVRDPIAPEWIQLTRALLLLGCIQAAKLPDDARGLIELDREGQRFIAHEWMRMVRESGKMPAPLLALLEEGLRNVDAELGIEGE
jgi:hypothetical protein